MHVEMVDSPESFTGRHIASIKILFDFILTCPKLHSCAIMAFVHIFVDVLDGFDRGDALNIDVTAIFPNEPWRMWYYPAIVNLFSIDNMFLSIISPPKVSIRVITDSCFISEWFWKAFRALVPIHARRLRILGTTWIVNHEFFD